VVNHWKQARSPEWRIRRTPALPSGILVWLARDLSEYDAYQV